MTSEVQELTVPQAITYALQAHRAGKLQDAQAIYQKVLALAPDHPDALHLLGVIHHQRGDDRQALRLIDRAISLDGNQSYYYANRGLARYALGDAPGARADYDHALALQPNEAGAHHNLARLLHDQGNNANAIEHYRRAIECGLDTAELYTQLGVAQQAAGQLHPAIASFHCALIRSPEYLPAFRGLADVLSNIRGHTLDVDLARRYVERTTRGENTDPNELALFFFHQARLLEDHEELDLARACLEHSLVLRPNWAEAKNNLGSLYFRCGQQDKAIDAWRQTLAIDPKCTEALNNLGTVLTDRGQFDEPICYLRKAMELSPTNSTFHENLGRALLYDGDAQKAELTYRRALQLQPDSVMGWSGLGAALVDQHRFSEAIEPFRRVVLLDPKNCLFYANLGTALGWIHNSAEAITSYRKAIELAPDNPRSHYKLSCELLSVGQFQEGWREYEWRIRHRREDFEGILRDQSIPASLTCWNGEPLNGRAIVLVAEQGQGDGIQFIRYATLLSRVGARVHVACSPALVRLFRTVEGVIDVFSTYTENAHFDYRCWLMSLPRLFGTDLKSIPGSVPYVAADPKDVEYWGVRLREIGGLKVGLVWAGGIRKEINLRRTGRRRDIPLKALAPLATILGVRFISLQKRDGSSTASVQKPLEVPMIDMTSELDDFADTAALIENLDLVISADTAVAHLAAALGKPTWLLSRYDSCWRWMAPRVDSPWYPTMKIYWQEKPGDWSDLVSRVEQDLRVMATQFASKLVNSSTQQLG